MSTIYAWHAYALPHPSNSWQPYFNMLGGCCCRQPLYGGKLRNHSSMYWKYRDGFGCKKRQPKTGCHFGQSCLMQAAGLGRVLDKSTRVQVQVLEKMTSISTSTSTGFSKVLEYKYFEKYLSTSTEYFRCKL